MEEPEHVVSDVERRTAAYVQRMKDVEIDVSGHVVRVTCVDAHQANDLANSIALIFADRIASWQRVLAEVPSADERSERLSAAFRRLADEKKRTT